MLEKFKPVHSTEEIDVLAMIFSRYALCLASGKIVRELELELECDQAISPNMTKSNET